MYANNMAESRAALIHPYTTQNNGSAHVKQRKRKSQTLGNTYISVGILVDTRKLSTINACVEKKLDPSTYIRTEVTRCTQARFGKRVVETDQDKSIDVPIRRIISTAALQLKTILNGIIYV